ncbi:OPT family oligopeptide transporter [Orrella sp. 11846]|uniref:OPT family oligopeptide transporter n=1 Tax=Orrella sp. 11846 TaxID=3409913 RepID=UPI003B5B6FCD
MPSTYELTLRGIVLGALITLIFTASNVYLGLKVGMTFASSIPAAVISMALLGFFKNSNILENNIVQTQASAAGTLSAVIFVLPALLMMGYWQNFPLFQTTMICLCGGILGVIFTIPLRRTLVVKSDLPYPEGVAAAEILKAGHEEVPRDKTARQSRSVHDILSGAVWAGFFSLLTSGLRVASDSYSTWIHAGRVVFQLPLGLSFALVGAGYLVGIGAGIALLTGVILSWGIAVPWLMLLTSETQNLDTIALAQQLWVEKVRLIGAGMIAIAAIWTLITLMKPMIEGLRISFSAFKQTTFQTEENRLDTDLSPKTLLIITTITVVLLAGTFYTFVDESNLSSFIAWTLVLTGTFLSVIIGFLVAAACGYMAGLVGSSASPISGIAVIAILVSSLTYLGIGQLHQILDDPQTIHFLTALALFCTAVVIAVAAISNDNLQDLKTGLLVHATPWRQQVALLIGCAVGAVAIPPILNTLYDAYGFIGNLPREGMDPTQALAAPQASLMITIADGLFNRTIDWTYILIGIAVGIGAISIDILLRRNTRFKLPPLAIALGLYLPPDVATAMFMGSLVSWWTITQTQHHCQKNGLDEHSTLGELGKIERKGTLFASGLIVGESLVGVVLAMIIVASVTTGGSDAPLSIVSKGFESTANIIGLVAFIGMLILFARRLLKTIR